MYTRGPHIHLCISFVDSESSCCGNDVRLRSLHRSHPGLAAGATTTLGTDHVRTRLTGYSKSACLLVERRGLPEFLPFITCERIRRRSAGVMSAPGAPFWSMNCNPIEACRPVSWGVLRLLGEAGHNSQGVTEEAGVLGVPRLGWMILLRAGLNPST